MSCWSSFLYDCIYVSPNVSGTCSYNLFLLAVSPIGSCPWDGELSLLKYHRHVFQYFYEAWLKNLSCSYHLFQLSYIFTRIDDLFDLQLWFSLSSVPSVRACCAQ
jgi:hypothetical protein